MDNLESDINKRVVAILKQQFSGRGQLTNFLCKLLNIDKVNVYRRLNNSIPFTLAETVLIAKHISVPLNNVFELQAEKYRSKTYQLYWQDFKNMNEKDVNMGEDYITAIQIATQEDDSEFGVAMNNMPLHILAQYPNIYRFFMLKWIHQFSEENANIRYRDVVIPSFLADQLKRYTETVRHIKRTYFISDETILTKLIRDIHYFLDIRLITGDEVKAIKDDLIHLFDNISAMAISGCYPNGSRLDMYTSGLSFETTYSYLSSKSVKLCMAEVYTCGSMSSVDADACNYMRTWMLGLKRTSTRITHSEKNRVKYLENQYVELNRL
jgi:hypothetical protein